MKTYIVRSDIYQFAESGTPAEDAKKFENDVLEMCQGELSWKYGKYLRTIEAVQAQASLVFSVGEQPQVIIIDEEEVFFKLKAPNLKKTGADTGNPISITNILTALRGDFTLKLAH